MISVILQSFRRVPPQGILARPIRSSPLSLRPSSTRIGRRELLHTITPTWIWRILLTALFQWERGEYSRWLLSISHLFDELDDKHQYGTWISDNAEKTESCAPAGFRWRSGDMIWMVLHGIK